jgi:uncharacterized RDD family membrane protein YckC
MKEIKTMSYNPNDPNASQWPAPDGANQPNPNPNPNPSNQPNYYPPSGYAPPPPNYQQVGQQYNNNQQPPFGYQPPQQPPPYGYQPPQQPPYGYQSQPPMPYNNYQGLGVRPADIGSRFVAILIDSIIVSIVTGILFAPFNELAFWHYFGGHSGMMTNIGSILQSVILGIYAVVMTVYFGGTFGKRIMNLRVVKTDGSRPDLNTYVMRYIVGYPVSSLIIGLGFIWAIFDPQKQGWHDKIAGTYVVKG